MRIVLAAVVVWSLGFAQSPAGNPACAILQPSEVSSLIGSAKALPVMSTANGGSCMFQNGDKMITVLTAKPDSAEAAQGLWNSKKRIAAGADLTGWPTPAYFGVMGTTPIVGVVKGSSFIEVKVIDATQKPDALGEKLKAVMKALAGRM